MPIELIVKEEAPSETEYALLADQADVVIACFADQDAKVALNSAIDLAKKIRAAGGKVSIYKRTEY